MNDIEFFANIDIMIKETLSVKSIKQMQDELVDEISQNRGNYKDNFKPALVFGEKGENIFQKFLENEGYIFISKCNDITSDKTFLKDGKEWVFEIKTDACHFFLKNSDILFDTGNILFEYSSGGKESGIHATKAEVFVTYFPQLNEFWLIRTAKIKKLIEEAKYEFVDKKNIGDKGSETHGLLTKRDKIKSEFKVRSTYESDK